MPTIANERGRIKPDMSIVCRARSGGDRTLPLTRATICA
jgi:hypothetical protein